MLPFQALKSVEDVVVAGIPMKKRGCLTVAEMEAAADLQAELESSAKDLPLIKQDLITKQHIATILLRSRVDRNWTLEQTKATEWQVIVDGNAATIEPDMQMLNELFLFFMNEQRQWKDVAEEVTEPGKKQTGRKSTGS